MLARTNLRIRLVGCLAIFVMVSALARVCISTQVFEEIEFRTWDWRAALLAKHSQPDPRIKIVAIDQASLSAVAKDSIYWKWPRELYAGAISFLERAGAKGVAVDLLFNYPSHHGVEDDRILAESSSGKVTVVHSVSVSSGAQPVSEADLKLFRERQQTSNALSSFESKYLSRERDPNLDGIVLSIPELLRTKSAFGDVRAEPESDGVFRRARPGVYFDDTPVLTLPFAFANELSRAGAVSEIDPDSLRSLLDEEGKYVLRFKGDRKTYPFYSISDLIYSFVRMEEGEAPLIDPAEFKDSFVFIGATSPGLMDLRPTPLSTTFFGVELNATIFDNLLHGEFVRRISSEGEWIICVLLALLVSVVSLLSRSLLLQFFGTIAVTLGYIFFLYERTISGWWWPATLPLLATLTAFLSCLAVLYALEGRQRKFIRNAFGHFVSAEVVERIVADPKALSLGGERRELTIFFSDIAGFTTISETLKPSQLVELLNLYLGELTDIILESGGTLDKYEGDAIIAFWNAPLDLPSHAERATNAALSCQAKLLDMKSEFEEKFGVYPRTRMGLHTGEVSVGNFGSKARFDYTIIGDAANLAARIEGLNKVFGTLVLISEATWTQIHRQEAFRRIGEVRVVGKKQTVVLYSPWKGVLSVEGLEIFDKARRGFENGELHLAKNLFSQISGDPVTDSYLRRIETELERSETFDPVWNMTKK